MDLTRLWWCGKENEELIGKTDKITPDKNGGDLINPEQNSLPVHNMPDSWEPGTSFRHLAHNADDRKIFSIAYSDH